MIDPRDTQSRLDVWGPMSQSTIESDDDAITWSTIEREHPQGRTILLADCSRQIVPLDESEVVAQRQAHPRSGLFPCRRHHDDGKAARMKSLDEPNQARRLDSVVISQKQRRSIHNPATGDSYIKRSLVPNASRGSPESALRSFQHHPEASKHLVSHRLPESIR